MYIIHLINTKLNVNLTFKGDQDYLKIVNGNQIKGYP